MKYKLNLILEMYIYIKSSFFFLFSYFLFLQAQFIVKAKEDINTLIGIFAKGGESFLTKRQ